LKTIIKNCTLFLLTTTVSERSFGEGNRCQRICKAECSLSQSLSLPSSLSSLPCIYPISVRARFCHSLADSRAHSFIQFHSWPSPSEQQGGGEVLELDVHVLTIDRTPHPSSTSFIGCKAPVTPHIQSHDQSCTERVWCQRDWVSESAARLPQAATAAIHVNQAHLYRTL